VQALASPDARVTPDFDGTIEINGGVLSSLELIGGYRYMRYDSLNVNVLAPGAVWYIEDDAWLIFRGYVGWVPGLPASSAGTVTLMLRASLGTTLRIGGFTGNEVFQATSVREISDLKSSGGFAGFKSRISSFLAVEGLYQYTSRNLYGDSHLFTLTVSTLF
ncbi:MAG TPA: YaiO family outer membrane beta-barrel protein, partial [Bacteroidota bacterium]